MFVPKKIAVWNTAFLGDAVLTLPLLRVLKTAFPDASMDFYVRSGLAPLFAAQPELNAVHGVRKRGGGIGGLVELCAGIRKQGYDVFVNAHPSPRSALVARMSGAPVRIGYSGLLRRLACTDTVPRRFGEMDEIERLLQLAPPLFSRFDTPPPKGFALENLCSEWHWPHLALQKEAEQRAEALFSQFEGRPTVGLHPGSVWATKRWTPSGFALVAKRAAAAGAEVLLFAGPGEEGIAREVAVMAELSQSARLHDLSGALSLPELAACLSRLSVYVSNDSGPLHIAWSQHVPVVAMFGPTVRDFGFYPRGRDARVFELKEDTLACRPCGLHGARTCPQGHHRCMTDIDPEAVWKAVEEKLLPSR